MQFWIGYHKQHESGPFEGRRFFANQEPSIGDHLFVVVGDKARGTLFFADGEYEIAGVEENLATSIRQSRYILQLKPIVRLSPPTLLNESNMDMVELKNRHISGSSVRVATPELTRAFGAIVTGGFGDDKPSRDIEEIAEDSSLGPTEKAQLIQARLGQGKFRRDVIGVWGIGERCALTGTAIRDVLNASHIIPWRERADLRVEGSNGILLCAHVDRLFDRHLISFDADGKLIGSDRLKPLDWDQLARLGIARSMRLNTSGLNLSAERVIFGRMREHSKIMRGKGAGE